ncbi:MAG: sensor histidine kinase [Brumimicrobium sp.]|nr:sensor histidine kinase [Brumimicrobium sp.]
MADSLTKNIDTEISHIQSLIENSSQNTAYILRLKLHLNKLYNRAGKYERARELLNDIPPSKDSLLNGDLFLAKAINLKYELQPESAKSFFDKAILIYTENREECRLIEARIELIEYYRKFDVIDYALKEAEKVEILLRKTSGCEPLLSIRYLNRLAALQNTLNGDESMKTSYRCIDSCLKYNEYYYLAISYNELGYSYQHVPNLDSADHYYRKSEDIFHTLGLMADFLHVKMNRHRMYAHNRINLDQLIPGLIEIETKALEQVPGYDLSECYRSIWVEAQTQKDYETAFTYLRKFYYLDLAKYENDIAKQVEKVKQQEKESETRIQNFILADRFETQKTELDQTKTIAWVISIALIILIMIMLFLFKILKQRDKLSKDLSIRNKQKDELIQEVHHRVKNNLSFVSSLLEMQISSLPEESKTEELKNAGLRIESMSLVHQMLYTQDDIATIDLSIYVPELFSCLKDSLIHEETVEFVICCEPLKVESRTATALGLIITEFVTNSCKHAFKGVHNPKIEMDLYLAEDILVLTLKDNGIGIESESKIKKGFGMRVIDIFSRQINATTKFSFSDGTRLTLQVNYEK